MKKYIIISIISIFVLSSCNNSNSNSISNMTGKYELENGDVIKINSDYTATIILSTGETVNSSWSEYIPPTDGIEKHIQIENGKVGYINYKEMKFYFERSDLRAKINGVKLKKK